MKRKIIHIDPEICNGCGQCLPNCPEGALQLIDNKARLVSDLFCDGLGACIGTCPLGAIRVVEREAAAYDENQVMANIVTQGTNVIRAHLDHLFAHNEQTYLEQARQYLRDHGIPLPDLSGAPSCLASEPAAAAQEIHGCPGSRQHDRRGSAARHSAQEPTIKPMDSELKTWPVQLQLLNPQASFFDDANLLIAADCVPFVYSAFHSDFVRDKIPVVFCPKLDRTIEQYLAKLTAIFTLHPIRSLHIVHMEVPCCSGTVALVRQALAQSGKQIPLHEYTISLQGQLLEKK